MQLGIEGDRILVIGASEGIGYETALALSHEGARVLIASRRAEAIARAALRIQQETQLAVAHLVVDVTDAASADALITQFGGQPLDALVIATGG